MQLTVSRGRLPPLKLDILPEHSMEGVDNVHYFIGRSPECHITLDDYRISRNHAQISFVGNEWKIKKTTESGELFLNGMPVEENEIKDSDIIQILDYSIAVALEEEIITRPQGAMPAEDVLSETNEDDQEVAPADGQEEAKGADSDDIDGIDEEATNDQAETDEQDDDNFESNEIEGQDESVAASQEENIEDGEVQNEFDSEGEYEQGEGEASFDEGEGDGDGIDDGDGTDETKVADSFISFELSISGEHANFDKFYISKEETFIGRDPERCQIVLDDPESGKVHAVIRRSGASCTLEDLDSKNGTILNGKRINQALLKHRDEFLIGGTSFQIRIKSSFIGRERKALMPFKRVEEVEVEEVVEKEVDVLAEEGQDAALLKETPGEALEESSGNSLFSKETLQDPGKRKKIMIYAVALIGLWVLLEEEPKGKKAKDPKAQKKDRSLVKKDKTKKPESKAVAKRSYEALPRDLKEYVRTNYELAKTDILEYGNFEQGLQYLDKISEYVDEFEQSKTLEIVAKEEFKKLEAIEKERKSKQEREANRIRAKNFLEKANEAFEQEKIDLAQSLLNKAVEIDPENIESSQLKLQINAFIREKERKAVEEAQKKARRERLEEQLRPGKNLYLKEKWYYAIIDLENFLAIKNNDDDLIKQALEMLKESQSNLKNKTSPLLLKAKSLKEGQDLKGAYRIYKDISKIDPGNAEIVELMDGIKEVIDRQAKKIYREAIIDESLNYLKKAKEKFQEVRQITPRDSQYHSKAENKLRSYVDE